MQFVEAQSALEYLYAVFQTLHWTKPYYELSVHQYILLQDYSVNLELWILSNKDID